MRLILTALAFSVGLTGCLINAADYERPAPTVLPVDLTHDEVAWATERGENAVLGQALMRTRGGEMKTCAGLEVLLIPVSAYSAARIENMFGGEATGFAYNMGRAFTPDPTAFHDSMRRTICDAHGNFTFDGLPDGKYYVIARVVWDAVQGSSYIYTAQQGGFLMSRLSVTGGISHRVILTA